MKLYLKLDNNQSVYTSIGPAGSFIFELQKDSNSEGVIEGFVIRHEGRQNAKREAREQLSCFCATQDQKNVSLLPLFSVII